MLPCSIVDYLMNGLRSHREQSSKFFLIDAFRPEPSYFHYFFVRKFGKTMSFTSRHSPLFCRITDIVLVCAKKEMIGVATGGIVSPRAVVAQEHSLRDRAFDKLPRNQMCANGLAGIVFESSVTTQIGMSYPQPARIGFVNELPKSFFCGALFFLPSYGNTTRGRATEAPTLRDIFSESLKGLLTVLADSISVTSHRFFNCFRDAARLAATNCAASFVVPIPRHFSSKW